MNNKLDLEVFKSRCACLTEILSSYREGLLLLESCDLKDFHNNYMTDEFMRELKVLCEGIYSYLNINKSKTQYKSILGSSSICILYIQKRAEYIKNHGETSIAEQEINKELALRRGHSLINSSSSYQSAEEQDLEKFVK
ncbi:hypothetical protein [Acinetobacter indicus]|uniref:hypothetical protein n=1 Tax=Acinetobacter indicus TaxID=756892 RepID=UPI0025751438|nr:hypothetical protein [Acinetobacter indicus]MDM1493552.1 hypothetical protein [Acinetobacter indicus]